MLDEVVLLDLEWVVRGLRMLDLEGGKPVTSQVWELGF